MALQQAEEDKKSDDDVWTRSGCELCLNNCGILVHSVKGRVVKIEGDPENPLNRGMICAKGNAGFMARSSPYRITKPLIRTVPEKGVGVDPKWREATWEEAIELAASALRELRKDDPRKLYVTTFMRWGQDWFDAWANAFGTQSKPFSAGFYCGNNVHPFHLMTEGGFSAEPDTKYTRYLLLVGSQYSSVANYNVMDSANEVAGKRPGGIKVVCVDPIAAYSASKAEEWVPIRPGTDAAFLLALANLMVNEYGLFDREYLKNRTNAPYLVDGNGHYARDPQSGKPLVWDAASGSAKAFDDGDVKEFVIEGDRFRTQTGEQCRPAFQALKDHLRNYPPDKASKISTVPEQTIRRIAKEFGEAANIGGTITIKGKVLPLRTACVNYYRGLSAHKHSFLSGMAANLLNTLIGAIDVPGGSLCRPQARAFTTKDGLMTTAMDEPGGKAKGSAYPPRKVLPPKTVDLYELFPVAAYSRPFFVMGVLKPEVYKAPYELGMLVQTRSNIVKTSVAPEHMEKALKKIPFMLSITMELDETANFADVVFPDVHYLERLALPMTGRMEDSGDKPGYWYGQAPAASPPFKTPWGRMVSPAEILLALAERAGFIDEMYESINYFWGLKEPFRLETRGKRYSFPEIVDRQLRNMFGAENGLDWFTKKPLVVHDRGPEQMYPGAFRKDRVHIYHEYMLGAGDEVRQVTKQLGLDFWETADYQPLPDWKPCPDYELGEETNGYDLFLTNFKIPQQPMSYGQHNALLQSLTDRHRDDDIMMNSQTASRKGISDGDEIIIETIKGKEARGRVRVTERVHPEVMACQGAGGRFSRDIKVKRGINYNDLVPFDERHIDFVSAAIDSCVRVKVRRAT